MAKPIFTQSENMSKEYCATIVRIDGVQHIEGTDHLATTLVNGITVVVDDKEVKDGHIMIYAQNETELNEQFLSVNNQFDSSEWEKNANHEEVAKLIAEGKKDEAKERRMFGFFNKYGRVKMIKLKGVYSKGVLFTIDSLLKWKPELKDVDFNALVDQDFDTIGGDLFIKVYMPRIKPRGEHVKGAGRKNKRLEKIDRMIPGQFVYHYDTSALSREISILKPGTLVYISTKWHGTSAIVGNVKVKAPKWDGIYAKLFRFLPNFMRAYKEVYDDVYSSRTVIKNSDINPGVGSGFYTTDVWTEYGTLLHGRIPKGMTIYGEIIGYETGHVDKMFQKKYDYGCAPGTNKMMIYRITTQEEDGTRREWEIPEVNGWTKEFAAGIESVEELKGRIVPLDMLFSGTMRDLYPTITESEEYWKHMEPRVAKEDATEEEKMAVEAYNTRLANDKEDYAKWKSENEGKDLLDYIDSHDDHNAYVKAWHNSVLAALKVEKRFHMEENEPLCKNKVPREGFVLRIANDPNNEAFKLKCDKFFAAESKNYDSADGADMEALEKYA